MLFASIGWVLYALFYTFLVVTNDRGPFFGVLVGQLLASTILGLLSIPPWLLIVRSMESYSWPARIMAHVLIAPIYAWISLEIFLLLIKYYVSPGAEADIREAYVFILGSNFTTYLVQFALYHSFRMMQWLRIKDKQAVELRALAKEGELAALKAQINPHFLFNTLNSINAMVTIDAEKTREMIARLADLLRYALDSSRREWVTLGEELEFARDYLELEKHRFADRLRVKFEGGDKANDVLVPPMVLQPLIENAVKHGISRNENGGDILIRIVDRESEVEVLVEDSGKAVSTNGSVTHSMGIGLENTRERLEKSLGPAARLFTESLQPNGFRTGMVVPHAGYR